MHLSGFSIRTFTWFALQLNVEITANAQSLSKLIISRSDTDLDFLLGTDDWQNALHSREEPELKHPSAISLLNQASNSVSGGKKIVYTKEQLQKKNVPELNEISMFRDIKRQKTKSKNHCLHSGKSKHQG